MEISIEWSELSERQLINIFIGKKKTSSPLHRFLIADKTQKKSGKYNPKLFSAKSPD